MLLFNSNMPPISVDSVTTGFGATLGDITVNSITNTGGFIQIPITFNGGTATVTDSNGNLYLGTTTYGDNGIFTRTLYCLNPIITPTMVFHIAANNWAAAVMIVTGSASSNFDKQNGNGTTGTSLNTGSITPTQDNELIIAAAATGTPSTGTPPAISGYTLVNVPFASGVHQGLVLYYKILAVAAPVSVTFAGTNLTYFSGTIVSMKN